MRCVVPDDPSAAWCSSIRVVPRPASRSRSALRSPKIRVSRPPEKRSPERSAGASWQSEVSRRKADTVVDCAPVKCKVVAGGANNQLAEARHGDQLRELGILYAPDFVVNAGGLMNVFVELEGYTSERAFDKTKNIYDNVKKVFQIAKRDNIGTHTAADRLAEERMKTIGQLKQRHQGKSSRAFTTLKEVNNR